MKNSVIILLISCLLLLTQNASTSAGFWINVGRWLGWGWSDGYHARSACQGCSEAWDYLPVYQGPALVPLPKPEIHDNNSP